MAATPVKKSPAKPRAPRARPLLAGADSVATVAQRPVVLESEVFRNEIAKRSNEVAGAIDMIDASELQAEANFKAAVEQLTKHRDAERSAQAHRRADLYRILAGCGAAMNASEAAAE